jgi:hypothetical protein
MQTAGFPYGGMRARSTPASPLLYFLWQQVEGILATPSRLKTAIQHPVGGASGCIFS